jgi:hypothetical protein
MGSNTHSTGRPTGSPAARGPDRLGSLTAALAELAATDLDGPAGVAVAEDAVRLRRLVDRLEGQWLRWVAAVDAQGAAGVDQGQEVGSTAAWLRSRLRMRAGAARTAVRTARALFRGPASSPHRRHRPAA